MSKSATSYLKNLFLDIFFPKICVGCGRHDTWLCEKCQRQIILIKKPFCPSCQMLNSTGSFCSRCRPKFNFTGAILAGYYHDPILKELIHGLKYRGITNLTPILARLLIPSLISHLTTPTLTEPTLRSASRPCVGIGTPTPLGVGADNGQLTTIFIPIPLHSSRRRERGFNQAELICRELKKLLTADGYRVNIIANRLVRRANNRAQIELTHQERLENVRDIFSWRGGKLNIKAKRIFLVDDVITTGATMNEAAKTIKPHLSSNVQIWALAVAKG